MKKNYLFGLLIIALSVLVVVGCGTAPAPAPAAAAPAPAPVVEQPQGLVLDGAANYTVARGDTLADIAASRYGGSNMYYFPLIRLANARAVPNPDAIEVGTNLVIPNLQRNLSNAGAMQLIRQDMRAIAAQYDNQGKPKAAATLRNLANR
jgi:Tfp pilus assembly protein FimV